MNYLKKYRIKKGFTQEELGSKLDVTQPTIQRWESSDIPKDKIELACRALDITESQLLMGITDYSTSPYNTSIDNKDEVLHYGEVHLSFLHGENAFYPITQGTMNKILLQLEDAPGGLISFDSLNNRLVIVPSKNLVDIRFLSEADDGVKPYMKKASLHTYISDPDDFFWDYVRARDITEEEDLNENIEAYLDSLPNDKYEIIERYSCEVIWQITTGQVDSAFVADSEDLLDCYNSIEDLKEFPDRNGGLSLIDIPRHGKYHHRVLLNMNHVNYLSLSLNGLNKAWEESDLI